MGPIGSQGLRIFRMRNQNQRNRPVRCSDFDGNNNDHIQQVIETHTAHDIRHTAYGTWHTAYGIRHTAYGIRCIWHTAYGILHKAHTAYGTWHTAHGTRCVGHTAYGIRQVSIEVDSRLLTKNRLLLDFFLRSRHSLDFFLRSRQLVNF
jgi:hypothetical protein